MTKQLGYVGDVKNCTEYKQLTVLTNVGSLIFDRKWCLTFLPLNVHVNDNYLAKVLSLKYVNNIPGVYVTMDSSIEKAMNVILRYGTVFKFNECVLVLYYYDTVRTDVQNSAKTNTTITPYSLFSTVT